MPADPPRVRDRRTTILDAAASTLLRHGPRKTSVDDVARAAGISRQGVYLHFPTRDSLLAATIDHLLATSVTAARQALAGTEAPLEDRLLAAFAAMTGDSVASHLDELLGSVEQLTGRSATDLEREVIAEFTAALTATPETSPWRRYGDSAASVATALYATSSGLKRLAPTVPDYLDHLRQTIRFVCTP